MELNYFMLSNVGQSDTNTLCSPSYIEAKNAHLNTEHWLIEVEKGVCVGGGG